MQGYDHLAWMAVAADVVERGIFLKFNQNTQLRDYLLGTGNAELVEASPGKNWGIGVTEADLPSTPRSQWGPNWQGHRCMRVRRRIQLALEAPMPRAVTMAASSLQISGTGRGLGGAGRQDRPTERPVPRDISADSPVRPLADSLGMRGKECGGRGDCGPNSLACSLEHAGVANVDGAELRRAVVAHG